MQTSFCTKMSLSLLALVSMQQADALVRKSFYDTGAKEFSVHGVFREMVVKTALHSFVQEHLPNSHFFRLHNTDFDLHDIFNALSDALADIVDGHFFPSDRLEHVEAVRVALAGTYAHKLWETLADVLGVTDYVDEEVKDAYNNHGKAWFKRAFGHCVNEAYKQHLQRHIPGNR